VQNANDVLEMFEKQIRLKYPRARFVIFDPNENECEKIFYRKDKLKYELAPAESQEVRSSDLINVGEESIKYLKSLIMEIDASSEIQLMVASQLNKLDYLKAAIGNLHSIHSREDKIHNSIQEFLTHSGKTILEDGFKAFEGELESYFAFGANNFLKAEIYKILHEIDSKDTKKRFSKNNYSKYLISEFSRVFSDNLFNWLSDVYKTIFENIDLKLQEKLKQIQTQHRLHVIDKFTKFNSTHSNRLQSILSTFNAGRLLAREAGLSYKSLVYAFGAEISIATTTAMGVEGTYYVRIAFFGGLSPTAILGIGLALAAGVAGLFYVGWTREGLVRELTEEIYKYVTGTIGLKAKLRESGKKNFEGAYERLKDVAGGLFSPMEKSIMGCEEYGELVEARERVEELLLGVV